MSFLKIETVDARQLESNADVLSRLRRDEIQAVIIKGLFAQHECDSIVSALEANRHNFPKTDFPGPFQSFFYGANLNLAHPDLKDYFAMVPAFDHALEALMQPFGGFEARVFKLMSQLDGGRPYQAAEAPDGIQHYMATTIRGHLQGGFIPAHFDNEQTARPTFRHLLQLIQGDVFSFVVTLHRSLQGGVLEVYDMLADQFGRDFVNRDSQNTRPDLSTRERISFDVEDGTMVLVHSGRYLHQLTPVDGGRTRWTFCSFMAQSRSGEAILCWG